MNDLFFANILSTQTVILVSVLQKRRPAFLDSFYLSGGTALSLQIGHRESLDLDFFSQAPFDPRRLEQELATFGELSQTELSKGTLNTFLDSVKLQFLEYPYPLIEPTIAWKGVQISSVIDIACTKLQTVSMRGSKKDFVDLYFLLDRYPLEEMLTAAAQKYAKSAYSQTHILKSLVYFVDAEGEPMPRMHKEAEWEEVKTKLTDAVKKVSF